MKVPEQFRKPAGRAATGSFYGGPDHDGSFASAGRRVLGWAALVLGAAMMAIGGATMVLNGL